MTDDEILAAADSIRARRRKEAQLASFLLKDQVMIRWDNDHRSGAGESYTAVLVPASSVEALVRDALGVTS